MFNKIVKLNIPVFKIRCLNYSSYHKGCYLLFISEHHTIINKKDLIKDCDGLKNESECCWFKDINLAEYL